MCLFIDFADVGPRSLAKFAASTRNILTEYQKSIEYGVAQRGWGSKVGWRLMSARSGRQRVSNPLVWRSSSTVTSWSGTNKHHCPLQPLYKPLPLRVRLSSPIILPSSSTMSTDTKLDPYSEHAPCTPILTALTYRLVLAAKATNNDLTTQQKVCHCLTSI